MGQVNLSPNPAAVPLHGELDHRTPMEVERTYYADQGLSLPAIARQETG